MESLPNEIVERILRSDEVSFHDLVAFSSTCSRCISFWDASKEPFFTGVTGSKYWQPTMIFGDASFVRGSKAFLARLWPRYFSLPFLALTSLFRLEGGALIQVAWTGARS